MDVEIDTKCCRTCLESTTDNLLLTNERLSKKLEFVTGLRIIEGDGLPMYFCNSCQEKLEVAYKFRLQSLKSFKYLKNFLSQIHNKFTEILKSNSDVKVKKTFVLKEEENKIIFEESYSKEIDLFETEDIFVHKSKKKFNREKKKSESITHSEVGNEECAIKNKKSLQNEGKITKQRKDITNNIRNSTEIESESLDFIEIADPDLLYENNGIQYSECDVCHKIFRKGNLNRHKEIHTGNRKFKCEMCEKTFTQKSSLQRHHLLHTGEKPYECEVCGKKCTQLNNLKFHMSLHGKQETFGCSLCRYKFIKSESLAMHMKEKHSSQRANEITFFVCEICKRGFKSKSALELHKKRIHKDLVFDMDWSDVNDEDSNEF